MRSLKLGVLIVLAACHGSTELGSTIESELKKNATVTRIRVNGLSTFVNLIEPDSGTSGFLTASKDQIANTSALDFAYATPSATDPDIIILTQGAGAIPNEAFVASSTSAQLTLTTPFPTTRCEVSLETGEFDCAAGDPIAFDLSWASNGFSVITERTKRTEQLGPVITKSVGEFEERSANIAGSWGGFTTSDMAGNILDTESRSSTREITVYAP